MPPGDPTPTLVAGVDTSTQSCKVIVCDAATGDVVRIGRGSHPDATEVDPQRWWEAFEAATSGGLLDGVSALAVGGQQHGMVLLDEADHLVRDALLWNDTRSADAAQALVEELGGPQKWAQAVGLVPVAATTISKLRWMRDQEPDNLERTRRCVLPHDWLTGQILRSAGTFSEWTTDAGDASGTGYYSAQTQAYRSDLLEMACGKELTTPRVAAPNEVIGHLPSGLALAAGTGDNMAAGLGLSLAPGEVVISLGTSGTAFARTGNAIADSSGAIQSFADAEGGFLPLVCTLNAARVLVAGAAMLGVTLDELSDLALQADGDADGVILVPFLDGERTPDLPTARGSLHGLTRTNMTPQHIARAVVEGMLLGLVDAVRALEDQGVALNRILLIGGASASPAVQHVAAELFGVEVVVPAPGEYVALGAARQAAWAISGDSQPPKWPVNFLSSHEPHDVDRGAETVANYRSILGTLYGV